MYKGPICNPGAGKQTAPATVVLSLLVCILFQPFGSTARADVSDRKTNANANASTNASSIGQAFTEGAASLQFRYRYEWIDQADINNNANASTFKTTLGYETLPFLNTTFVIEIDNVSYAGDDRFNNTRNGRLQYPVVADPDGTHINQAYLGFRLGAGNIKLGRQRINLGNQRFIGGVGWRQNEQTYDAATFTTPVLPGLSQTNSSLQYGYISRVSRIFGPDKGNPPDDLETNIHFINLENRFENNATLDLYIHTMDFKDADILSNRTVGASFQHAFKSGDWNIPVRLEYARQRNHADSPLKYRAAYYLVESGIDVSAVSFRAGVETLEGGNLAAFQTPLATLHKFQGWVDKFLTTPVTGIKDTYVSAKYKSLTLVWHQFDGERGGGSLGNELDVSYTYKLNEYLSLLLKGADYQADGVGTDTRKIWLMVSARF